MTKKEFDLMEVKVKQEGTYIVTLYEYVEKPRYIGTNWDYREYVEKPRYIRTWLYFDGTNWDYREYVNRAYVCFIHTRI